MVELCQRLAVVLFRILLVYVIWECCFELRYVLIYEFLVMIKTMCRSITEPVTNTV